MKPTDVTHEFLLSKLDYDPNLGKLLWKNSKQPGRNGSVAGKISDGTYGKYAVIGLLGRNYTIARVVWFYVNGSWPAHQIRFLDCNPSNCRIENLYERIPKNHYPYMGKSETAGTLGIYKQKRCPVKNRKQALKARFGITPEQYAAKLLEQNGVCAICSQPETRIMRGKVMPLSVDHDHATGKIRDLLCGRCNSGLGHFADDPSLMIKAIGYVRRHAASEDSNIVPFRLSAVGDES